MITAKNRPHDVNFKVWSIGAQYYCNQKCIEFQWNGEELVWTPVLLSGNKQSIVTHFTLLFLNIQSILIKKNKTSSLNRDE